MIIVWFKKELFISILSLYTIEYYKHLFHKTNVYISTLIVFLF